MGSFVSQQFGNASATPAVPVSLAADLPLTPPGTTTTNGDEDQADTQRIGISLNLSIPDIGRLCLVLMSCLMGSRT